MQPKVQEKQVIPMDSSSTLKQYEIKKPFRYKRSMQFYRMAGILFLAFSFSFILNLIFPSPVPMEVEIPVVYEEHNAPPGVKSNLTLQDGSKVILNSGSSLRYIKNFEADQRVLELNGEAFFEVARDQKRPFKVKTGPVTTTALGTSFNIEAYDHEAMDIALFTGKVAVALDLDATQEMQLEEGEGIRIELNQEQVKKVAFDPNKVMAWTNKTIVFDHSPMHEIKRVLENWYGVKILFTNAPDNDLEVSGRFYDQNLRNVLEGLSYSARFDFKIERDEVNLVFK